MDRQNLLFEYSPAFLLFGILLGLTYAYLLYQTRQPWNRTTTRILFFIRATLVTLIVLLLLGPILKLSIDQYEKPAIVWVIDNSTSVREVVDSIKRIELLDQVNQSADRLKSTGYDVAVVGLSNDSEIRFDRLSSDLNGTIQNVMSDYEGKNLSSIIVVSDGIYNSGVSPLYLSSRAPISTVGVGDTTDRIDISLKNILYNKIAYQGNKFPLRAEVLVNGVKSGDAIVSVSKDGKVIHRESKRIDGESILQFDFQIEAEQKGFQRLSISVEPIAQEQNKKNNYASAFVDVVEGKKRIVMVAPAPHPDLRAIRSVVEKNSNYEFVLHIPGVKETSDENLKPANVDLAIFHQVLDYSGKSNVLFKTYREADVPMLVILGEQTNLRQLAANELPITFESPGQWDEITPMVNADFKDFNFSANLNNSFVRYPPVSVPFGKFTYPPQANVLLFQRIGRVNTDRPFLLTINDSDAKIGILLGNGIWRWRLDEYAETQRTDSFDEVFSKLIQYLSTREDKKKFKFFPLQNEFSSSETVVFESQIYNDLFEPVYGNKVDLTISDADNKSGEYSYVTSPGNSQFKIGGLKEGVYRYRASTALENLMETVTGEFLVTEQNIESQNLTADFNLLRKWAAATGGKFYNESELATVAEDIGQQKAQSIIRSEESFNPLINLKLFFFFLLLLISTEWFTRKYLGSY